MATNARSAKTPHAGNRIDLLDMTGFTMRSEPRIIDVVGEKPRRVTNGLSQDGELYENVTPRREEKQPRSKRRIGTSASCGTGKKPDFQPDVRRQSIDRGVR